MTQPATIRELFTFDDWAANRIFDAATPLDHALLDREFDMGFKSLRVTLIHAYGAKQIWIERLLHGLDAKWEKVDPKPSVEQLRRMYETLSKRYDDYLRSLDDGPLQRTFDYRDMKGNQHNSRLLDVLLHVANHGAHHRAQALNMLRHIGAKPPRVDYLFRYFESPNLAAPTLSREVVAHYFKCTDWARNLALSACENLSDEQLDRQFEVGIGSIRAALSHTEDAERWWLHNWIGEPMGAFPTPSKTDTIAKLRARFEETAQRRNAFIQAINSDDDLKRIVEAKPWPDRKVAFPLGVTMLQLCTHGTHHRAQIFNMLKRVGGRVPANDLIVMTRES